MKKRQSKTPERLSLGEWFLKCKPQVQIVAIICATVLLAWMMAHPAVLQNIVTLVQLWSTLKGNAGCNCNH